MVWLRLVRRIQPRGRQAGIMANVLDVTDLQHRPVHPSACCRTLSQALCNRQILETDETHV